MTNVWQQYDSLERNISVKIVTDSISNETLERVTTALWHVPRFLLPQLNTHRAFSRNVSSCLTGNCTVVCDYKLVTIDEIYTEYMSNGNLPEHPILCYDKETFEFTMTFITDVIYNGLQSVYRLTLTNGFNVTATSTHRIDTIDGWQTVAELIENPVDVHNIKGYTPIESIVYVGIEPVYDISIAHKDEAFLCNAIVVHNSRAKKLSKTLNEVKQNPYVPYIWQAKHKGMQGSKLLSPFRSQLANIVWRTSASSQLMFAWMLDKIGVSNQYANRIIEPYMYVDYLVTSTDWNNFFHQRDDWHAQLEIQIVARRMKQALKLSIPDTLHSNDWHLPFITEGMRNNFTLQECIKISVARCARTSYKTGALFDYQTDLDLFNTLIGSPPHFSPFEHQVVANGTNGGNLDGVTQLRKIIEHQLMLEKEFTHEYFDELIDTYYV